MLFLIFEKSDDLYFVTVDCYVVTVHCYVVTVGGYAVTVNCDAQGNQICEKMRGIVPKIIA